MAKNLDHFALTEAQKLLAPYLDPGEKLLWAERVNLWAHLPYVRILVSLFFCFLPLFIIAITLRQGTLTTQPLIPAIGIIFSTVGAHMLFSSFRDVPTLFALSHERAFILKSRLSFSLFSISLALIRPTLKSSVRLGKGSLIFNVSVWLNDAEDGPKILPGQIGFWDIENPHGIDALIKKRQDIPAKNIRSFSYHPLILTGGPKKFGFSFDGWIGR